MTLIQEWVKKMYVWIEKQVTNPDYVDNGGTSGSSRAMIDTWLVISDNYLRMQFWVVPLTTSTNGQYYYNRVANPWLSLERYNSNMYFNAWSSTWIGSLNHTPGENVYQVYDITYGNGTINLDVNGTTYTGTYSWTIAKVADHLFLAGAELNGTFSANAAHLQIYYWKVYTGSTFTLVRDFVPAIFEGKTWMWDNVNNVFYWSATQFDFTAGYLNS